MALTVFVCVILPNLFSWSVLVEAHARARLVTYNQFLV